MVRFDFSVVIIGILPIAFCILLTDFICYLLLTPQVKAVPRSPRQIASFADVAILVCHILSLLRIPFTILPYLTKLGLFFLTRGQFAMIWRSSNGIQLLRILGDGLNFWLTLAISLSFVPDLASPLYLAIRLAALAEAIRLVAEKGQMLISAGWQMLPHHTIAFRIPLSWATRGPVKRYITYYRLDDDRRLDHVLQWLTLSASADPEAANRLAYVQGFHVVPNSHALSAGQVRDIAHGEVFIHRSWTNDPWLLIGQAMRRGPWLFDPRYLPRPFYYRTQANRLATRFVLEHAAYSPPYAWFQFGHEIKVGRFDVVLKLLRRLGFPLEQPVREDGTYEFDPLLAWLAKTLGWKAASNATQPLWSDEEVIAHLMSQPPHRQALSAQGIAERYSYPLCYVEDVLIKRLHDAQAVPLTRKQS